MRKLVAISVGFVLCCGAWASTSVNQYKYQGTVKSLTGVAGPGFSQMYSANVEIPGGEIPVMCQNAPSQCYKNGQLVPCCSFDLKVGDCVIAEGPLRATSSGIEVVATKFIVVDPSYCP